jgi:hypothetical protein
VTAGQRLDERALADLASAEDRHDTKSVESQPEPGFKGARAPHQ